MLTGTSLERAAIRLWYTAWHDSVWWIPWNRVDESVRAEYRDRVIDAFPLHGQVPGSSHCLCGDRFPCWFVSDSGLMDSLEGY